MSRNDDIKDNEFRVIGKGPDTGTDSGECRKPWRGWIIVAVVMLLAGAGALYLYQRQSSIATEPEVVFEPLPEKDEVVKGITETPAPLGNQKDSTSYTEHLEIDINDITLDIYIPHNGIPSLSVGAPDINDDSVILATQAADIRADNGKIVGAFVLKGKPLSWGLSKKGFCGIIDGEITVGVADNSPLFEKATETGGYFFRQFPLVDNGQLVENEYKGKSIRKALCDRRGEIFVAMSRTPESFHDFAQALVDLGVSNAIYLVGSQSYGVYRDSADSLTVIYDKYGHRYKYENYILWRKDS